jgi:hypothetical protein
MKLDKEIKTMWLEGLRSGMYKQGRMFLNNTKNDTYCCLGVLADVCEVLDEGGCIENGFRGSLPPKMLEIIGLSQSDMHHLMDLNDEENSSFEEIADYIELAL